MTPVLLDTGDMLLAGGLIFGCVLLSVVLSLGIHRTLAISALRMAAQLLLTGSVLLFLFGHSSVWLTLLVIAFMLTAATIEVGSRQTSRLTRIWHFGIGGFSTAAGTILVALVGLFTALHPHPWYQARTAIPMTGLLLGNVMNATSLSMNTLLSAASRERTAIEARLVLGATRFEAMNSLVRQAIRTALIPTLNQMAAAGVITLPGIMTGQILAGMNPLEASKYQIVLMSLIVTGNMVGATLSAILVSARLCDARGRLRLDHLA
ncbi:ABC transporter permease [Acetobacter farinalis]|uniref:ABC transporter permease n=1 Tax=Acetobacter farinalis TaxID=1260984 RepID=A0ABT3Q7B6_9PROT|nr:ABC transporter permease [Acetobacter farinalis]MCX2561165.1 ABC transporter permease [Acetobacter farinalis]NHO29865.1 ABC transporter permease [Acetobacter farinalis]